MNDLARTSIFVGVAVLALALAAISQPTAEQEAVSAAREKVGSPLFNFEDPEKAASLRIVKFNDKLAELTQFEVARDPTTGQWEIPSRSGYPADAETQMRDAALAFVNLTVLDVASELASDHETFGVAEPKEGMSVGQRGVGLLVRMKDKEGNELAKLIIGKPVKGAEGQRFVRVPQQDAVFLVKIDPTKFDTKFETWIEKDLLKMNPNDIEQVSLRDYSVSRQLNRFAIAQRLRIDASYNTVEAKWSLDRMLTFGSRGEEIPTQLLDDEELNTARLNELKNALDDLQIADVIRKPAGLGGDLKVGKAFMDKNENIESLFRRGFFPLQLPVPGKEPEAVLFSANGEVHVTEKDGVKYILRFGGTAGSDEKGESERYLFVTVELDESKLPMPKLDLPPEADAAPQPPGGDPKKPAADPKKPAADGKKPAAEPAKPAADPKKPAADPKKPEGECQGAGADEKPSADPAKKPAAQPKKADPEAVAAAREKAIKEYERKMEEYREKRKKAEARVRELSNRFADWYYVISNDTYKKIHLSRGDLIKEKEVGANEGTGIDDFRKLQKDGLKKP